MTTKKFKQLYQENLDLTRKAVRESIGADSQLIQALRAVTELQRAVNTISKRCREWFSLAQPELGRKAEDNEQLIGLVLSTKEMSWEEMLGRNKISQKSTMGVRLPEHTMNDLREHAKAAKALLDGMKHHEEFIEKTMKREYPNMEYVAGSLLGAKLISHAGSIKALAMMPATRIQLLGAEKALFRHLRTKARCPKHGLILEHPLLARAKPKDAGKIARALADKISIASRVDFFKGAFASKRLRLELEQKFGTW